jgi:hypothetical protein
MFASVIIFSIGAMLKKGLKKWQPSERYAGSAPDLNQSPAVRRGN